MKIMEKLLAVDRRIIFVLLGLAVIVPFFLPLGLKIDVCEETKGVYDVIENLPEGSVILLSHDYGPSSEAELYPMAEAIFRHCFKKNHKVITLGLWPPVVGLIEKSLAATAKEYDKKEGVDYVFLGCKVGGQSVIVGMGEDIKKIYKEDHKGTSTAEMQILKNINSLKDIDYAVSLSAGVPGLSQWIVFGSDQYGFKLGGGCTGVMVAEYYPYLNTKQLTGLLRGLKGAAEYEMLIDKKSRGVAGMDAQSIAHAVIILFVILGNVGYFITRRAKLNKENE